MTESALPVTQSAVEQFSREYLAAIGCSVRERDGRWTVTIPDGANTALGPGEVTLVCSPEPDDVGEEETALHPESSFFQRLIDEASERTPVGAIALTAADTELRLPEWVSESDVDVVDATFAPYYDRSAAVVLVRVGIETVSEYQTELLRAVAIDARSGEELPGLSETFLEQTTVSGDDPDSTTPEIDPSRADRLLERATDVVLADVQPDIDEIHENASRSADAELEEFRQLKAQRIGELEDEIDALDERIEDLSETIRQASERGERADALRTRKDLKADREELERELTDLRQRMEAGFPEKQREIRDRHALEVSVEPVTMTIVDYERGELELTLSIDGTRRTLVVGYGSGVGVTDRVECRTCGSQLTAENPLRRIDGDAVICSDCRRR